MIKLGTLVFKMFKKLTLSLLTSFSSQDFSVEQDSVRPLNGWKSYYAATKAVVNINAEFYNIIKERSLQEMSRFWLRADYVKCVHASGELFAGYACFQLL